MPCHRHRFVSGLRVVAPQDKKTVSGFSFVGYGSHHSAYPYPYFTAAAALVSFYGICVSSQCRNVGILCAVVCILLDIDCAKQHVFVSDL